MGNKRQLSCHWPTGFCSGHKVLVIEVTLRAGLDNPIELRSCLNCPSEFTVLAPPQLDQVGKKEGTRGQLEFWRILLPPLHPAP